MSPPTQDGSVVGPRKRAKIASTDEKTRESLKTRGQSWQSYYLEEQVANLNVLIVDDDPVSRDVVKHLVETRSVTQISVASDGIEALKVFQTTQKSIDLVLMDVAMPNMDGITAVNKLRKYVPKRQWPYVAMVTAKDTAVDIQDCNKRCSPNKYITKPVRQVDLAICLREAVLFSLGEKEKGRGKPSAA